MISDSSFLELKNIVDDRDGCQLSSDNVISLLSLSPELEKYLKLPILVEPVDQVRSQLKRLFVVEPYDDLQQRVEDEVHKMTERLGSEELYEEYLKYALYFAWEVERKYFVTAYRAVHEATSEKNEDIVALYEFLEIFMDDWHLNANIALRLLGVLIDICSWSSSPFLLRFVKDHSAFFKALYGQNLVRFIDDINASVIDFFASIKELSEEYSNSSVENIELLWCFLLLLKKYASYEDDDDMYGSSLLGNIHFFLQITTHLEGAMWEDFDLMTSFVESSQDFLEKAGTFIESAETYQDVSERKVFTLLSLYFWNEDVGSEDVKKAEPFLAALDELLSRKKFYGIERSAPGVFCFHLRRIAGRLDQIDDQVLLEAMKSTILEEENFRLVEFSENMGFVRMSTGAFEIEKLLSKKIPGLPSEGKTSSFVSEIETLQKSEEVFFERAAKRIIKRLSVEYADLDEWLYGDWKTKLFEFLCLSVDERHSLVLSYDVQRRSLKNDCLSSPSFPFLIKGVVKDESMDASLERRLCASEAIVEEIIRQRNLTAGLLPVGGKVHTDAPMSVISQVNDGLGSTGFKLIHANASLCLPPTATAFEQIIIVNALAKLGVTLGKNPEYQMTISGRWDNETAGIVATSILLGTDICVEYEPGAFSTNRDHLTGAYCMVHDAGNKVHGLDHDLPQAKGRTDMLGRRGASDIAYYQILGTLATHQLYDGPLKGIFEQYAAEYRRILDGYGLLKTLEETDWVYTPGDDDLNPEQTRKHEEAVMTFVNAWKSAQGLKDNGVHGRVVNFQRELAEYALQSARQITTK